MHKMHDNLPLTLVGIAFVTLTLATHCSSPSVHDQGETDAGPPDARPPLTPQGCTKDTECSLPPSTCDGVFLVYYTNAKCVQRQCQWEIARMNCYVPGIYP